MGGGWQFRSQKMGGFAYNSESPERRGATKLKGSFIGKEPPMTPMQAMERLKRDKPKFHYADEDVIRRAAKGGFHFQQGDLSLAVSPGVLKWMADHVTDSMTTIETGAG